MSSPPPEKNTRRFPRTPMALLVQYRLEMSDAYVTEYSVDLSPGGIFLRTDATPPLGSLVQLQFSLKDGSQLIEAIGRVTWVSPGTGERPAGIGVEFLQSDPESQALIERLCRTAQD
jgi:uncharacterized protein (TIGR02266 family)